MAIRRVFHVVFEARGTGTGTGTGPKRSCTGTGTTRRTTRVFGAERPAFRHFAKPEGLGARKFIALCSLPPLP